MKKILSFALTLFCLVTINAMEPLTPEQLAKLAIQINSSEDGFSLSSTVSPEYTDASNPTTINIQNFNGTGMPLRMNVDWETATVSVIPSTFDQEFDEDTYQTFYLMVVNAEAAELASPMDSKFQSSKITGTISEDGITLDSWNIVRVPQTFSSMTKVYSKTQNTRIVKANATMSQQRLDWDADWENLVDAEEMVFRIYTETEGENLMVYGWDGMESCVKFKQNVENGKYTYSNNAADVIYNYKGKRDYVLCTLPGYTWDELSSFTADKAKPVASEEITDSKELVFGQWIVESFGESYNNERTFGKTAKITFDNPLPITITTEPNATFTFDGKKESVIISFMTTNGNFKAEINGESYTVSNITPNTNKSIELPLNGATTVAVYADGLSRLNINEQGLTAIDLTNAPALTMLQLAGNALTELNVTGNPLLTGIYAENNNIASIDITNNTALRVLSIFNNNISGTLDMSAMQALSKVDIDNNNVSELILPTHSYLVEVDCENNQLANIDIAGRKGLRDINIYGNNIKSLNLSGLAALESLYAGENEITEIKNLADCKVIETLNVSSNQLTDIDISVAPTITGLYLYNNNISTLDISKNPNISWMNVSDNHIGVLDLSKLTNLRLLHANNNELKELDLSNSPYCSQLTVGNNNIDKLDLSKLTALYWLKVDGNNLTELDVTNSAYLSLLECGNNKLTSLDISKNTYLRRLAAEGNMLTSIDIASNPNLCGITLQDNAMDAQVINNMIDHLINVSEMEPLEGSEWITILDISRMPGTKDANIAAATAKGWNVMAEVPTSINDIDMNNGEVASVSYYTVSGMSLGSAVPQPGYYIKQITFTDGRTVSRKCFVK